MTPRPITHLAPPNGGRFAAIIFDMGGTLLEFENVPWDDLYPASLRSLMRFLRQINKPVPSYDALIERFFVLLERRRARGRVEMREYHITPLVRELLQPFSLRLHGPVLSDAVDAYYSPIRKHLTVYSDAAHVLRSMQKSGHTLGLLSNTPFRASDHLADLERYGLKRFFNGTVFTSTLKYRKPHPEPFRVACSRLGVSPKRALYIGDRQYEDVQGPQRIGMTACLIRRNGKPYEPGLTRSAEINSLGELIPLLGLS